MKCPGPGLCPYANERRFTKVCLLVAALIVAMTGISIAAIVVGKDGVITGAACGAMSAAVCSILVGGIHRHRATEQSQHDEKGGDN